MTAGQLKERLIRRIEAQGPMTVAEYMTACLADPEDGYYKTREPFGAKGDFITAPEVSQMFGELIGAFCLAAHERLGSPSSFRLVEIGPGRGTLMTDLLRMASLRPDFLNAADLWLVETSPRLRQIQEQTLKTAGLTPSFADRIEDVPEGPMLLVANEFFDALPIHQYVKAREDWLERLVGTEPDGSLQFGAGTARLPDADLPPHLQEAEPGTILETQPASNAIAETIAARLVQQGGTALFIDYGYLKTAHGDTLQALRNHSYDNVLSHPGEADLTAHVNFEALASAARKGGAKVFPPLTQGEFLLRLGLLQRAGALGAGKSHSAQEEIRDAVERLAAPQQMGELFKVLAISGNAGSLVPFDD